MKTHVVHIHHAGGFIWSYRVEAQTKWQAEQIVRFTKDVPAQVIRRIVVLPGARARRSEARLHTGE